MNCYVHVPFCLSKCHYCAFYSEVHGIAERSEKYAQWVAQELAMRWPVGAKAQTLYWGGGTPSVLGPKGVLALGQVMPMREAGAEFTMEVNPADVTADLVSAMRAIGINRVSLGVQALDAATLRFLGRRHTAAHVNQAVQCLRRGGFENLSMDLILGIPGQTDSIFDAGLAQVMAFEPKHISVYVLTLEPETPLARAVAAGTVVMPSDDAVMDLMRGAMSQLEAAGYERYEISNTAKPGAECQHNRAVWHGEDYVGVGPGAASRVGLLRRVNATDFKSWQQACEAGIVPPAEAHAVLSVQADSQERWLTGLRLREGVYVDETTETGRHRRAILEQLEHCGLVSRHIASGRWALTRRGCEVADGVMRELLGEEEQ